MNELIIPDKAGLNDYRKLLLDTEKQLSELCPKLTQYRIDRTNARNNYDDALGSARINAISKYDLKPNHQTMVNAYASQDETVKVFKAQWMIAKAVLIKGEDKIAQLQGFRDSLKCMIKSEQVSY